MATYTIDSKAIDYRCIYQKGDGWRFIHSSLVPVDHFHWSSRGSCTAAAAATGRCLSGHEPVLHCTLVHSFLSAGHLFLCPGVDRYPNYFEGRFHTVWGWVKCLVPFLLGCRPSWSPSDTWHVGSGLEFTARQSVEGVVQGKVVSTRLSVCLSVLSVCLFEVLRAVMCAHHSLTCTQTNLHKQDTNQLFPAIIFLTHKFKDTRAHTHEHRAFLNTRFLLGHKLTEVKGKEGEESANRVKLFSLLFFYFSNINSLALCRGQQGA